MKLKDKVQHTLDESRMLILGVQVLLGFDLQAFFMKGFDSLPRAAHEVKLVSLALLSVAMILLMAPVARHRIVNRGHDTEGLCRFARATTTGALLPFAVSLGLDFFIVVGRVASSFVAAVFAAAATLAAVLAWYGIPFGWKRSSSSENEDEMEPTKLNDKIRHVLSEARVVLPGTQALLGFQFAAALQDGFDRLPAHAKTIHLLGLGFLSLSVIFLMLPAAFHRIAEKGEISHRLHHFSSACVLIAIAALALGLSSALFVVVEKTTNSLSIGVFAAVLWLVASFGAWFAAMFVARRRVVSAEHASA